MHSDLVATIVFVCTFGGALLGMWLRTALPEHHVDDKSRNAINAGVGLIAAMSALVLGLITASAKSSFDSVDTTVQATAVDILTLDRVLARYGPEAGAVREELKKIVERRVDDIWPLGPAGPVRLDPRGSLTAAESLIERIRDLKPHTRSQETLQPRALELAESLLKVRWLVAAEGTRTIPLPFLVILLLWLTLTFTSFGLFSPNNATVIAVLFVCALSIAGALFLVLEMDSPFQGWLKVSAEPMRFALSHLNQ
jgi:hypothetical protein